MRRYVSAASAVALAAALSTSVQGQVQTSYTYDVYGRLIAVTRPDGITDYTYDNAGNRTRLTMTQVNRAPVANLDILSVTAGQAVTLDPRANDTDADSDPLTVTAVDPASTAKGTITRTNTSVTYTAYSGQASGTDSFTYALSDGKGGTATGTVNVTINAGVAAPAVANTIAYLTGNTANNFLPLSFSGGAPTSVAVSSASANGTASPSGTAILFSPSTGWSGQTALQYTASNSGGTSSPAPVTINVAPVVSSVSGTATTGQQNALALDPRTTYTSMGIPNGGGPTKGSASISGSTVYYTPTSGQTGTDTFSYVATSPGGTSQPASITFNLIQGNRPPVANTQTVDQYQLTTTTLSPLSNDSDPDGDALTLQSVGPLEFVYGNNGTPSDLGTLNRTGNTVSYTAPFVCNCAAGSKYHVIRFPYIVSDGKGGSSTSLHAINVYSIPTNTAPTANTGNSSVWQSNTTWIYPLANDTDPDGDPLTIQSIDSFYFAYGQIDGVNLSYAPADIGSVTNNGTYLAYRSPFLTNNGATASSYIVVVVWYTISDGRGGTSQSYEVIPVYAPG